MTRSSIITALALLLLPPASEAYIDPATGSMLVQGLLAAIAAGLAFMKIKWTMIKAWFHKDTGTAGTQDDVKDDRPES